MSIWIATVGALDKSNASQTLRFSDVSFIDNDGNYFENRMLQPALIKVSPDDGGTFKIFSSPSIGEIELINKDGGLNYLMDYALDNGNISLSLVNDDGSRNDYLTGKVESMRFSNDMVYLTVRSMSEVLTRNHVNNKFLGNNALPDGVEGVAGDIKGNIKPRVFGSVLNATPVFVNTSQLIYQFSDRTTATINAVYDKGVALTLHQAYTWANFASFMAHSGIASGKYITCAGYAKLGTTPAGTITGDCSDSVTNAGDVFESILVEESLTLDATSKSALNAIGAVGIYVTSEVSTSALLNQIAQSCGAYWYFMQNVVYAKLIALATTSTLTLTNSELITIDIVNTGIGENGLPVTSVSMQYDKIETVQQETDLAGAVTAARKAVLSQQYRSVFVNDSAVQTRHPLAPAIKIDSILRGTSTNLLAYSEQFDNAAWAKYGTISVSANDTIAPDGTLTADTITIPSSSGIYQSQVSVVTGNITISIWLKGSVNGATVRLLSNTNLSDPLYATVILTTDWQRFSFTRSLSAGTTLANLQLDKLSAGTVSAWGAQLEVGSSATGYIPTTNTAVSKDRALEVATTLLNLSKVRVDTVNITAVVDEIPSLTLGNGVTVFSDKLSYDYGKLLTIIGFQIDAKRKEIILECIG